MLQVQIKATPHGLVVIDPGGEMHPCFESAELWDCLEGMVDGAQDWQKAADIVADAVLLQVKGRRDALVVIDPHADIHPCEDDVELWQVVHAIIKTAPALETSPALVRYQETKAPEVHTTPDTQVIYDDEYEYVDDPEFDIDEFVMEHAVEMSKSLFSRLRKMSHRGAAPKPGSRRPKRRVKRGDII